MFKFKIFSVGKNKESWLEEALSLYETRMKSFLTIEWVFVKNDEQLEARVLAESTVVCLDPQGSMFTSEGFSSYLEKLSTDAHARLAFVIGGADGLPPSMRASYPLISLSKMTLTHQMTRLLLVEQIYRAFDLMRGGSYHK